MGDGGGKGPIAYRKMFGFPGSPEKRWLATCRVVDYDCDGKPFGRIRTWETPGGKDGNGGSVSSVRGYGLLGSAGQCKLSSLIDMRTLKMTADGCCPPELTKGYIMQEGGEMVEKDAVEEAIKLRKRGYFGGGG